MIKHWQAFFMESWLLLAAVLLFSARYVECLHCFHCHNVSEGIDCNVVAECNVGESCYIERSGHDNDTRFSLGCIPRQDCPDEHQFTMVGRSVQSNCKKCCSVDGCNKQYCEPQHISAPRTTIGSCIDDPTENCTKLSAVTNVCAFPHRAKDICRKYCGLCDLADGSWGNWNGWSKCSTTCGMGLESTTRQCNDPAPAHGGYDCPGNKAKQRSCFPRACPVHGEWSGWAQWEPCSSSCGTGLQKRHRTCTHPPPSIYVHYCLGDAVEYGLCHGALCGNLSSTSTPSPTASHCEDILDDCDTANMTFGMCNNFDVARKSCAEFCGLCGIVDGIWADWSSWTPCSTSCGQGTRSHARTCSNPPPQNGGKICAGNTTESKDCTKRACPVHGGWGAWANWAVCSSTCGKGITSRTRVCDNPRPQMLGNYCFGDATEYGLCLIKQCPVDGGWTEWSFWWGCSTTCGNGHHVRQRSCTYPSPANGGLNCPGPRTEQGTCNAMSCPVNGGWSTWSSWSACNNSAVRGMSQRQRTCTKPSPSDLGRDCNGESTDKRPCPGVKTAFTVTDPVAGLTANTLRFTYAIANIGGHYSTSTGVFTCQFPGIYVFALHILKTGGTDFVTCSIRRNQSVLVTVHSHPVGASQGGYLSSSNSAAVHLARGDEVDVGGCTAFNTIVPYSHYTSFSGFMLKAD